MKRLLVKIIAFTGILLLGFFLDVRSQARPPGGPPGGGKPPNTPGNGPPTNPPPPDVPITGLEILLVGGGLLGSYKAFRQSKKK